MALHPQGQGHQAAQDQPGVEGAHRAAQVDQHLLADAVDAILPAQHDPAQGVAVPVEVLGQAVHHIVGAQGQRPLKGRPGKGRVDRQRHVRPMGDLASAPMSAMRRIGLAGVSTYTSRVLGRRASFTGLQVAGVHQADLNAQAGQMVAKQLDRAGVADLAGDHVVALPE